MAKLMRGRSDKGEQEFHRQWVKNEWNTLVSLHKLGVRVPIPIAEYDDGVLMEYIGTMDGAAPRLIDCRLDEMELKATAEKLYHDIEIMLAEDIVHGDLSPYNILYSGEPVIIDVPQAMDLRTTPVAHSMMQRDLTNLDRYFEKRKLDVGFLDLMDKI